MCRVIFEILGTGALLGGGWITVSAQSSAPTATYIPASTSVSSKLPLAQEMIVIEVTSPDQTIPAVDLGRILLFAPINGLIQQIKFTANVDTTVQWLAHITLSDFRDSADQIQPLVRPGGPPVTYFIVLRSTKGEDLLTKVVAKDLSTPPLTLKLGLRPELVKDRKSMSLQLPRSAAQDLYNAFESTPQNVTVKYQFDPELGISDQTTHLSSIGPPNEAGSLNLEVAQPIPFSAKPVKVKVQFRTDKMPRDLANRLATESAPTVDAVTSASFVPPKGTDRATSEYYFEVAFTSTKAKTGPDRNNSGVFGVHVKPVLFYHEWNTSGSEHTNFFDKPVWGLFRPAFESDVDTLPTKTSKSPNRSVLALDYDFGFRDWARGLPELIFTNGLRFDSDRDLKVVDTYWHAEVTPRFFDFEETQDQRLFQALHRNPYATPTSKDLPVITAYRFKPSLGYELGETTRRVGPPDPIIGDSVSRLFLQIDALVELKKALTFGLVNTSYDLVNATRRNYRDYLEARIEVNTGVFLKTQSIAGFQDSILIKFQRGQQPPTFAPVNTFSLGFKVFR
jgi:hypothetical protein